MVQDKHKTAVVFRMVRYPGDKNSHLLALFPYEKWDSRGHIACYARIGQHGGAHYFHNVRHSRPATEIEYAPLFKELTGIGYNLRVLKKRANSKALEWKRGNNA